MRKTDCQIFLRHPSDVPINVNAISPSMAPDSHRMHAKNIGLAFKNSSFLRCGIFVKITIPIVQPCFELCGYISRCSKRGHAYEVRVLLMSDMDAMRVRMVEQICYIEHYRRSEAENTGRVISGNEAALEWIRKYASSFPGQMTTACSH